jgi:hypothetical protein
MFGEFMKRWVLAALALLWTARAATAQEPVSLFPAAAGVLASPWVGTHPSISLDSAASASPSWSFAPSSENAARFRAWGDPAPAAATPASPANPHPAPAYLDDRTKGSLDVSLGYTFVKFRSSPINAGLNGISTSVTYYVHPEIGIEGNITSAFSGYLPGFDREHGKYAFLGAGVRVASTARTLQPWGHALIGGVHMFPQTAAPGGQWGFGIQLGGGVDYRWDPDSRLWIRAEGDYVRSQLYSQGQSNFQIVLAVVLRLW